MESDQIERIRNNAIEQGKTEMFNSIVGCLKLRLKAINKNGSNSQQLMNVMEQLDNFVEDIKKLQP